MGVYGSFPVNTHFLWINADILCEVVDGKRGYPMQIEQTNLLDSFGAGANENTKGIANYIREDASSSAIGKYAGEFYHQGSTGEVSASGSVYLGNATYARPGQEEDAKTAVEKLEQQGTQTASERCNQAAVIANTTTPEDCARMQEEGFSLADTDSHTIITVTDKIKAELAKAGVDVSSFGDSLSREELERIVGDGALATQIAKQMEAQDVPLTGENLQDIGVAVSMLSNIQPMNEQTAAYMVQQKLPPTIQNIYQAQYSAAVTQAGAYRGAAVSQSDFEAMQGQISQIITDAGLPVDEQTLENSRWLMEQGLPLTAENLSYLGELKELSGRLAEGTQDEEYLFDIARMMTDAVVEGKRPWDGMMLRGYSWTDRSQKAVQTIAEATDEDLAYLLEQDKELTVANLELAKANRQGTQSPIGLITARRQLEETRLVMTAQANYALLKRGISIDTEPLVSLVEKLKEQENQYYRDLLGQAGIDATEEQVTVFSQTTGVLEGLKSSPAYVLNLAEAEDTLHTLYERGQELKQRFAEANERYETLMTAPRADLGDSIQKAFQNVDDILADLGFEPNEANRRAVRILAYNGTALTEENIVQIKAKDEQVQQAFANLTPRVTMELIRKNINPLDMEISELNQVAEDIRAGIGDADAERFGEYLWKLEQKHEITEEERNSYIGIYRLIAQVEKADSAAIGALVGQGAPLTMRNMLSAIRTARRGDMDYSVSDDFAGVSASQEGPRIDSQIEAGYQSGTQKERPVEADYQRDCAKDLARTMTPDLAEKMQQADWLDMTPEQLKEYLGQDEAADGSYYEEMLKEYSMTMSDSEEIYAYLEKYDLPNTMNYVQAVRQMLSNPSDMFWTLWNPKNASFDRRQALDRMKQQVLERFGEAMKTPQELADAQETLAEVAEHAMEGMIYEEDAVSYLDVRALRLMNQQFSICARQAKEENYVIPVETGDGITGVSLKIVRGKEKKGLVDIMFCDNRMGKVAASFEAKENGISGMIATDDENTRQLLSEHRKELEDIFKENEDEPVDIRVAVVPDLSLEQYALHERRDVGVKPEDGSVYEVQTTRLYHIAEGFIRMLHNSYGSL